MSKKIDLSRRDFLLKSTLISASTAASPFALNLFTMNTAIASSYPAGTPYKALVCVFLAGGNDHNNTVIATDGTNTTGSWGGYLAARDTGGNASIALINADKSARVQGITPLNTLGNTSGRTFGLHPNMPELKALFDTEKKVAIVANVGPLIRPLTKTEYQSNSLLRPSNLFSHSDQSSQWSNTNTNVTEKNYGWGGRIADYLYTSNTGTKNQFTSLSLAGNSLFLAGHDINQYQINSNGVPVPITGFTNFGLTPATLQEIITKQYSTSQNKFELDHAAVVNSALAAQGNLTTVMSSTAPASGNTPAGANYFPGPGNYTIPNTSPAQTASNSLATQLYTVARIITGRSTLGTNRQVFFVTLGGFDTHDFQATNHANLMAKLSHGINSFYQSLKTLPGGDMSNNVTLFTASDFGRTLASNGDGTDHGWGSHHFVVGGAVKGGDIYGTFPDTALGHSRDVGSGNLLPEISVDQYAATIAKWFGCDSTELASIFPNLSQFTTADLGFMDPALPV